MTLIALILWAAIAALIVTSKPLRGRSDCWWLALLWPLALALAAAILFYEIVIFRPIVGPLLRYRARRKAMVP